ncbi:DMT family transporter [Larsenimonas rhizosphaerae]|uniref:DMT family transporter n=1 Tax=Larsenimonas rhizosphaerae TaxID=2944682 RepID=A0AA41ZG10_9GAMM|nr:DMT family transporter [Larsenimonas rhizosphaerae]MCX2523218.1 DMT family transporter [Larsenimonas rhizosphaerae]
MSLWVAFTLLAAFMQSWRNAFQKRLSGSVDAYGVTLARFLWAGPMAVAWLATMYAIVPAPLPVLTLPLAGYVLGGAVAQIVATVLMITLFRMKGFATGVGLARSEALIAAILGVIVFGEHLSLMAWAGVVIGAIAVWIMKGIKQQNMPTGRTLLIGLGSGIFFALTTLSVRQATHLMPALPFLHAAGWVLAASIVFQTLILALWLGATRPATLTTLITRPGLSLPISLASFLGSLGWFNAVSLQQVALVKTLGQVEILITLLIARYWLKDPFTRRDITGLVLVSLAAVLVLWA